MTEGELVRTKKRLKKRWIWLLAVGGLALAAVLTIGLTNAEVSRLASQYITGIEEVEKFEKADCVMVLGAKVYSGDRLSGVLRDRMDTAIAVYEAGKADVMLLSGDHGQTDYDEVNAMMDYAVSKGVPKEDIFLDHAGFSTYESMYRARDVFCVESAIIVTQQVNLDRAVYDARRLGIAAYGVNTEAREYGNEGQQALREALARAKDYFYVNIFLPQPKYLGEAIPIWGSSDLTHDKV